MLNLIIVVILDLIIVATYLWTYIHGKNKAKKNNDFFNDSKYTQVLSFLFILLLILICDIAFFITEGLFNNKIAGIIISILTTFFSYLFTIFTKHLNVMKYLLFIDDYININKEKIEKENFNIDSLSLISVIEDYIDKLKDIYVKSILPYSEVIAKIENLIHNDIPKLKSNKENNPNCIKPFLKLEEKLFVIFKDNFTKYSPINKRLKELKKLNNK